MSATETDITDPFRDVRTGHLVKQSPETDEYEIWFRYTTEMVGMLRKGSFVAVENFDSHSDSNAKRFSLLEVMEAYPVHHALEGSRGSVDSAYPGFVMEAAKSASLDWEQSEPVEHTTVIMCTAHRSGRELRVRRGEGVEIGDEDSIPQIGEEARLLTNEMLSMVVNGDLAETGRPTFQPGSLRLDEEVPYHLDIEGLLKTHFGVFGFTGAGKSNLISTMVGGILSEGESETLVLADLMGEYTALLADLIHRHENSLIVATGENSLPGGEATGRYLRGEGSVENAVEGIIDTLLVPRELEGQVPDGYKPVLTNILEEGKVKVLRVDRITAGSVRNEFEQAQTRSGATTYQLVELRMEDELPEEDEQPVTESNLEEIYRILERVIEHGEVPQDPGDWNAQGQIGGGPPGFATDDTQNVTPSQSADFREFRQLISSQLDDLRAGGAQHTISRGELLELMDEDEPGIVVLQSDFGDELKDETRRLMRAKFAQRRREGRSRPMVSFILDEADEFIPSNTSDESTTRVRSAVETLARRGRKFGVGIGIATQRATYLDTNIMAQPHTYMISKLPREADRDRVGEAFGLGEEMLDRTLEFNTGEWLTVSYEAAGIDGFPIPVSFENANERIRSHLESVSGDE